MGIRIFDNDPDAKPKARFSDDIVGRFRAGYQDQRGNPVGLEEFRVTTGDPEVARAVADLLDGDEPAEWETKTEENLEVYTNRNSVEFIIDSPNALKSGMVLWGRNGLIHSCDGEVTKDGTPCPQAGKTVKERKEAAKAGHGCEPSVQLYFKLADAPELGKFKFFSGSWGLASAVTEVEEELADVYADADQAPIKGRLALEVVEFTTKGGKEVRYTKPVITILGPA